MDLQQLKVLSELKYQHSQQGLSAILARENELRSELERLRTLARETQAQPPEQARIRAIGADVIWLKWLGQAQRQLNITLAHVLAQKEALISQNRRAHGRKIVTDELATAAVELKGHKKRKKQLDSAIEQTLFK